MSSAAPIPDSVSSRKSSPLGTHLILELYDCGAHIIGDNSLLSEGLLDAVREAGATIVESVFHEFSPGGLSGVIVIAESHVTIHTWPERGYAAVDAFTCGDPKLPERIEQNLIELLEAKNFKSTVLDRGVPQS